MKKFSCLLSFLLITITLFSGCASAKKDSASAVSNTAQYSSDISKSSGSNSSEKNALLDTTNQVNTAPKAATAFTTAGNADGTIVTASNTILAQRKVMRNANISLEVEDFNVAYSQIKSIIGAFGYIQESNIKKDKVYVNSEQKLITKGVIILRVDKDRFDSMLSDVKGLGLLMDESIKGDDVTDQFIDTESMLRLLKYEESRLEEYLFKLTDADTIFKTQSRLTEIRQQIERLTGNLKKWSDLVELSTITINISEKIPGINPDKEPSYFKKLMTSFTDSFKGVLSFSGTLLILIVQAIPVIILLAIIAIFALWIYRKFIKRRVIDKKDKQSL